MDKRRVITGIIVVIFVFAALFLLGDIQLSGGRSEGEVDPDDWETRYGALEADLKNLQQEYSELKLKSGDLTTDQQNLAKSVESFLRSYFEYDSTTPKTLVTRIQPYSTQK